MIKKIISKEHNDGAVKVKVCDVILNENSENANGIIVEASNQSWKKQVLHTHRANINGKKIEVIGHCELGRKQKNKQYKLTILSDILAEDIKNVDICGYRISGRNYDYSDWQEFVTNAEVVAFES